MPFTNKPTPEEIEVMFTMSKAAFKRALGKLMKDGTKNRAKRWLDTTEAVREKGDKSIHSGLFAPFYAPMEESTGKEFPPK